MRGRLGFQFGERCGFARVDGWPVAVMASDPMFYGGGWTADTCQKVTRFLDLAETFHLPVVYFCDCPGFLIGIEAETWIVPSTPPDCSINFDPIRSCVTIREKPAIAGSLRAGQRAAAVMSLIQSAKLQAMARMPSSTMC